MTYIAHKQDSGDWAVFQMSDDETTLDPTPIKVYTGVDAEKKALRQVKGMNFVQRTKIRLFDQDVVNYQTISPQLTSQVACITCRWFGKGYHDSWDDYYQEDHCHLVDNWPQPIVDNGYCTQHTPLDPPSAYVPPPQPVYIVDEPGDAEKAVEAPPVPAPPTPPPVVRPIPASVAAQLPIEPVEMDSLKGLVKAVRKLLGLRSKSSIMETERGFKISTDGNRWFAWWTNNAEDLQTELFPQKSLDFYIKNVTEGVYPYPDLWYRHIPGTKHGEAKALGRVGKMCYAAGTFDATTRAEKFKAYYKTLDAMQVSHGFEFLSGLKIAGSYYWFRTFEISSLEDGLAANPYTAFGEIKAMADKGLSPVERAALAAIGFGEDEIKNIEQEGNARTKQIDDLGVRTKNLGDVPLPEGVKVEVEDPQARKSLGEIVEALKGVLSTQTAQQATLSRLEKLMPQIEDALALQPRGTKNDGNNLPSDDPHINRLEELNNAGGDGDQVDPVLAAMFPMFQRGSGAPAAPPPPPDTP